MTADQNADLIYLGLCLVLVASAVFSRRWSLRSALRMLISWVAIFAVIIILFSYRSEFGSIFQRVRSELTGESDQTVTGGTLRIRRAEDGHYWVNARINDRPVRLLVDSGASLTALSMATATESGVTLNGGAPMAIETANGTIAAERASIATLRVGPIVATDMHAVVSPAFGNTNVLGMNFLSRLKSWRVENGEMILEGGKVEGESER